MSMEVITDNVQLPMYGNSAVGMLDVNGLEKITVCIITEFDSIVMMLYTLSIRVIISTITSPVVTVKL